MYSIDFQLGINGGLKTRSVLVYFPTVFETKESNTRLLALHSL